MARRWAAVLVLVAATAGLLGIALLAGAWCLDAGVRAREEDRLPAALDYLAVARRLRWGDPRATLELAAACRRRGDYRTLAWLLDELPAEGPRDMALAARRLALAASRCFQEGDLEEARRLQELAVAEARDAEARARALLDLGVLLATGLERFDAAEQALAGALGAARAAASRDLEAEALLRIGELTARRGGDADECRERFFEPALALGLEAGARRQQALVRHRLGLLDLAAGRYEESRAMLEEGRRLHRETGDLAAVAESEAALGALEVALRRSRPGFELYQRARDAMQRLGATRSLQGVERLLADYWLRRGDYARATSLAQELLSGPVPPLPAERRRLLALLGHAAMHQGDSGLALARYGEALAVTPQGAEDALRLQLELMTANAHLERGQVAAAEAQLASAAAVSSRLGERGQTVLVHLARADLRDRQGRRGEALAELAAAAWIEEQLLAGHRTHFERPQYWQVYRRLQALLFAPIDAAPEREEAARLLFRYVEQMRHRAVRGLQARGWGVSGDEAASLAGRPVELGEAQAMLDEQTALVEYLFAEEAAFALVITRRRFEPVLLPLERTALEAKSRLLAALVAHPGEVAPATVRWHALAGDLDRDLVEPLRRRGLLDGVRRLGIVPASFLAELPFAALRREPGDGQPDRFLVEDHTLFFGPSVSVLASRWAERPSSAPLAVLALGREMHPDELGRLTYAEQEARRVAARLGGSALVGSEATEAAFRRLAPQARVLHLATHALDLPDEPVSTRLELAAGGYDDGRLAVADLLEMHLAADLVTLSACRTGRSHSRTGNDLAEDDRAGLVEAFLHAGSRTVVASLWPIADRPTSELMELFYEALTETGPAEALARAQRRAASSQSAIPAASWASFVVVGAPGAK